MIPIPIFKNWFHNRQSQIREAYFEFLRFASISADSTYKNDCLRCADWLVAFFRKEKIAAQRIETSTLPIVFAEELSAGQGRPTLLFYGHYDVQPVDPIELWDSPPFDPTERDGAIYARGAVDDKGQIFYAILAVACWKDLGYALPMNCKFCIEGEEEFHSTGLAKKLPELKNELKADYLLVVDFDALDPDMPAITLGARGLTSLEVTLKGSKGDLHSGMYGGIAYNPNRALVELLSKLWDQNGVVQVPGFYDHVIDPSSDEIKKFKWGHNASYYTTHFGIQAFGGEKGKSLQVANCFRPTLELNGIVGGYTGPGIKTVIPAQAQAKITCRLVPGQDPDRICNQIADFLKKHTVQGMSIEFVKHQGAKAFRGNVPSPLATAIAQAAFEVTGNPCHYLLSGGSIPIVPDLIAASNAEMIGMGYGLISDRIHAPNEHFDMHRLEQGFLTIARALCLYPK
ncbi:MAG TPA: dipeptidase [Chlamydiales bacterium]|nr:dipeptidase [Chlamydiales bacterium]